MKAQDIIWQERQHKSPRRRWRTCAKHYPDTAALSGLVKGASKEPVNEKLIAHFWAAAFRLEARIWLEYVDSKSNWADGISREYDQDPFVQQYGVQTRRLRKPFHWLQENPHGMWEHSKVLGVSGQGRC